MIRLLPATKRFEQMTDADMSAALEPLSACNGVAACLPNCKPFGHVHVGAPLPGATTVLVLVIGDHDDKRDIDVHELDADDAAWLVDGYRNDMRARRRSPRRAPRWRR